jgi:hypothetical protein
VKITVHRVVSNSSATISNIKLDGTFFCFGLEDEYRKVKVKGKTRIPQGKYNVTVRQIGGFHERYKKKFSDFHKGMLQVADVPNFTEILIHIGNDDED